jgi:tryptophan synthase beta subunit
MCSRRRKASSRRRKQPRLAYVVKYATDLRDSLVIVNLSGRGDKDLVHVENLKAAP